MSHSKNKRPFGRTPEAKLLITVASITATVAGMGMFAAGEASNQVSAQSSPTASQADQGGGDILPFFPQDSGGVTGQGLEQPPIVNATPIPRTRGSRRQGFGQTPQAPLGSTHSSR